LIINPPCADAAAVIERKKTADCRIRLLFPVSSTLKHFGFVAQPARRAYSAMRMNESTFQAEFLEFNFASVKIVRECSLKFP